MFVLSIRIKISHSTSAFLPSCCIVGDSSNLCTGNFGLEEGNCEDGRNVGGGGGAEGLNGRGLELVEGSSIEAEITEHFLGKYAKMYVCILWKAVCCLKPLE